MDTYDQSDCVLEIYDMPAGQDIDRLVAINVMDSKPSEWRSHCHLFHVVDDEIWCYTCDEEIDDKNADPPPYSSHIGTAWQVVEKIIKQGYRVGVDWMIEDNGFWLAGISPENEKDSFNLKATLDELTVAKADTAPLAICRAALKVVDAKDA